MQCGCSSELSQAGGDASGSGAADLRPSPPSAVPPCCSRSDEKPKVSLTQFWHFPEMSIILSKKENKHQQKKHPHTFCCCCCTRSSSVVCMAQWCHVGSETTASLPGLACQGWRGRPGLMGPSSPFPLLTSLGLLLETIMSIHKGLSRKVRHQDEFK